MDESMYERRNGREDAEWDGWNDDDEADGDNCQRGRNSFNIASREGGCEGERERELEGETQRVRVETGTCETEFKERTVKALFLSWRIPLDFCYKAFKGGSTKLLDATINLI